MPEGIVAAATIGGVVAGATAVLTLGGGAAGAAPGTVHTRSGGSLTIRSAPTTASKAVGSLRSGTHVTITCQATGQAVSGRYGRSAVWDRVARGYISDAYVYTGSDSRVAPACATSKPPAPTGKVAKVIAAAKSQIGKGYVYSWGGGGKSGASYGICCSPSGYDDRHRFGYDRSGLMQFVFWHALHKDVGGSTYYQYTGRHIAKKNVKPGDMIFYGHGSTTTHVALYIGGGKMIESAPPRTTHSVHITSARWSGSMPYVVRVV